MKFKTRKRWGYGFETCQRCGASGYDSIIIVKETIPDCDECKTSSLKISTTETPKCQKCKLGTIITQSLCEKCYNEPNYQLS